jgi:N-dimethylarginine dimethylaminohydrolase
MLDFGCQSMSLPLKRVLMRAPKASLMKADPKQWHYGPTFDASKALEQYQQFVALVAATGADIINMEDANDGLADAMFTHDPSLMSDHGAIILNMGKPLRQAEPNLHQQAYINAGIPILGRIEAPGQIEGGDCIWLDAQTLVIGRGFRSNQAGIEQLNAMLKPHGVDVLGFDLPFWQGPEACLHLMSVISPLAPKLALIHAPLVPTALYQLMQSKGIELLEAPVDEFLASSGLNLNVLPTSPKQCIMIDGFAATKAVMEAAGCVVQTFVGDALCIACEGGPTCLTRPILRGT